MSTSDSDLDDLVRAAMKSLDDEAPSGYFEALPELTLARLEGDMQNGTQGTMDNKAVPSNPPVAENTEDSGLHDIRNLAQSTKQRLSSKRIGTVPPASEDDVVASSSAGWKAVALPQPAKMVALPELAELPSKKEVLAREKATAKAEKAAAKPEKVAAKPEPAIEKAAVAVEAPVAAAAVPAKKAFALPSQPKKSKTGLYAVIGIGLAAAAGAAIFVATQKSGKDAAPKIAQNAAAPAAATAPTVTPIAAGSAAVSADVQAAQDAIAKQEAEAERMRAELAAAQAAAPADKAETKADTGKAAPKKTKGGGKVETTTTKPDETKVAPDKGKDVKKPDATKTPEPGDPDFNELLKEAGVKEQGPKKVALAKKELTGDDFKKGIGAITPAAKNCYKSTQGTATVKIVIAPSGQISKATVSGQFAGTPEGECVVNAVKGASFPAWDGGPQSFTYPILLSE
jgi:hypothetical protein